MVSRYIFRKKSALDRVLDRLCFRRVNRAYTLLNDLHIVAKMNLEGFNRWLLNDQTPKYSDGLWFSNRNQLDWVNNSSGEQIETTIIRFENFTEDVKNLPTPLNELDWAFKKPNRNYRKYYNYKTQKFIQQNFYKDIREYGYCF